jgi:hypothetical protein|tara:strand:- start:1152 stop:2006 length:855 start_codon:yes stop_codon:yes gene_type:complete
MRKVKYLNNRDLLKQIHISKNSFSSYTDDDYHRFDIILPSLEKVNRLTIAEAKRNQADRIGKAAYEAARMSGDKKTKLAQVTPDWRKIEKTSLVFRIMTFDHIPKAPGRKRKTKTIADEHERCNFPPFQHWKFDENDNLVCVGKSHWEGGMQNGSFSKGHGRVTEELGRMFLKLADRYGTRSNWRGYTYNDEMRAQAVLQLSQIGLQFDESKSENPFAYYTAAVTNSFTRVLNIEKKNQNIRDDILQENNLNPSFTRQNENVFKEDKEKLAEFYKSIRRPKADY